MLNHFEVERPPLPVVMLGTDLAVLTAATDEGQIEQRFARQLQALGRENDVLMVLTTAGNSNGLLSTVTEAHERGMDVIALTGFDGGLLANHLGPEDIELRVPSESMPRIHELHLFILHCFCDLIDQALFDSTP
jgi:D-sedoheptulose 7-phosphate isomerase